MSVEHDWRDQLRLGAIERALIHALAESEELSDEQMARILIWRMTRLSLSPADARVLDLSPPGFLAR